MRSPTWCRWLLAGWVAAGCLGMAARPVEAEEEARKFLEALRDPEGGFRYYDTALEYLEMMRNSPLVDQEFKDLIDYEAGITLIISSGATGDTSLRQRQLDQAEQSFKKFLADHPQHLRAAGANTQLANLLVERGRIKAEQAQRPSVSAAEKARLSDEARKLYTEAQKVLGNLETQLREELRKFPKVIDQRETKKIEEQDQVRRDLLQAQLAAAQVLEEVAGTYEPGSQENTDRLKAAATKYHELYAKYENFLAGLYARMWEGRCYRELKQTDKAFEAFEELLAQPSEPQAFRLLKNKALVLLLETAVLPEVKQYKKALDEAQKWEKAARGSEESSTEGLAIKYLAGEANLGYAKTLTEKKDAATRRAVLASARKLFEFVAGFPGEYQKEAREAARRPELVGKDFVVPEPADFTEACDRATDELYRAQQKDLSPQEVAQARSDAIDYYRMAIEMRPSEVTADEMNVIRYRLAWLYYTSGDFDEAAVIGEFLARRYPTGAGARQGAKVALVAYEQLWRAGERDQRQFETDRMIGIAEYITRLWEGEPLAAEAWMTLIQTALTSGDLQQAREYLGKVPLDSPRRGEVELMTGQRLWTTYLLAMRKPEDQRPGPQVLDTMVEQAQKILEDGIARMRKSVDGAPNNNNGSEVSDTLATAVLSLAQIYIDAAEPEKAVRWLEDPKIGALALAAANHPATAQGNFRVETYKAALSAYVSVQEVDKAKQVMKLLEDLAKEGGDPDGGTETTITGIYFSMGLKLKEQLERLRSQQKVEQLRKVSEAFEVFLDNISKRGDTFASLNWVAETFYGLGAGFDPGGQALAPKARAYYQKAADTYQKILQRWDEADFGAPADPDERGKAADRIKIRLARCLRRVEEFDEAMKRLLEVLDRRNTMIDAQVEAAYVYQALGQQDPRYYPLAINGGKRVKNKDGSVVKRVWGWGKIAALIASSRNPTPRHEAIFHEARYNLALCHFKMALSKQKREEKAELLKQAETDVRVVHRLYPKMGQGMRLEPGDKDWYEKYDDLLKKIQQLRGQTADGLKGLEADRRAGTR